MDHIRGSWLAPEIEGYVEWMASHGYAVRNFYRRVPILCQFAEFAKLHGATDVKSAASHIEEFALAGQPWIEVCCASSPSKIAEEAQEPGAADVTIGDGGSRHCRPHAQVVPIRGSGTRIYAALHYLSGFADYLKRLSVKSLTELSPALLTSFVVDTAPRLARTGKRDLCGIIRVFLRFCYRQQVIAKDLSGAVEMPQTYRLPFFFSWTYGLRAHEVAKLILDDIDWKRERLQRHQLGFTNRRRLEIKLQPPVFYACS